MGKFVIHGTLIEEPKRTTIGNGIDCISLTIEERYQTSYKEMVNVVVVDFLGKATNCVPANVRLAGAPVVILGTISSREFRGKYYYDLKGETLTIITNNAFEETHKPVLTQANVDESKDISFDENDLANDDLPF